jgi:hypothetical protein
MGRDIGAALCGNMLGRTMQLAGTTSWRIGADQPYTMILALFVRDAAGLSPASEPSIPPLDPPVQSVASLSPRIGEAVSDQWEWWWKRILEAGGLVPRDRHAFDSRAMSQDAAIRKALYAEPSMLPPGFSGLSSKLHLQSLVRAAFEPAQRWSQDRQDDFIAVSLTRGRTYLEWEVVRDSERALRRDARPFDLDIRIVPVAGTGAWRLSESRAIVSLAMYRNEAAYRAWLSAVVRELA